MDLRYIDTKQYILLGENFVREKWRKFFPKKFSSTESFPDEVFPLRYPFEKQLVCLFEVFVCLFHLSLKFCKWQWLEFPYLFTDFTVVLYLTALAAWTFIMSTHFLRLYEVIHIGLREHSPLSYTNVFSGYIFFSVAILPLLKKAFHCMHVLIFVVFFKGGCT